MAEARRVRIKYRPNNKSFGLLMMGHQTQRLADTAARAGVIDAQQAAVEAGLPEDYVDSIRVGLGPITVLGGNPRRTSRIVAQHRLAAVFEFGSGRRREREQGGHSRAYRILGRTGAKIANLNEFEGDTA